MKDQEKLREAIETTRDWSAHAMFHSVIFSRATLNLLCDAAESTLPKTKEVEVWHVEFAQHHLGKWTPLIASYGTAEEARAVASEWLRCESSHRCICVTGPHLQTVPA